MHVWQLQEAKAKLSEVVKQAIYEGPQEITLRGEPAVVMISTAEFNKLKNAQVSFVEFLRQSPLMGVDLDVSRNQDLT